MSQRLEQAESAPAGKNEQSGFDGKPDFTSQYHGGSTMTQTVTPGGHQINDELLAIGTAPRKIGNPLPLGVMAFATTTTLLSLYNVGVRNITVPQEIVTFALSYGGGTQYLAGLWEFACGNTLGATIFCAFGSFWWGFAMLFIPWFNELGSYESGVPGVYAAGGVAAAETDSAIGLFLWLWFGITTLLLIAAARSSVTLISLLFFLDLTFAMLAAFYYTGNAHFQTAGGALGILVGFNAYYLAAGSFLTSYTSYITLPLGSLAIKD
ncbi:unnamed protein product [Parajaminaea phylloscopi]